MAALHGEGISLLNVDSSGDYRVAKAIPDDPGVDMQWDGQTTVRTWGLIGAPGVSRSTRANQHLFVNRRPIENRSLNRALIEGYHTALMKGQFPVCCLFIEIAPGEVDVNIHPAKREVKFHHERDVRRLLTQAVQETLLAFHSQRPKPALTPVDEAVDVTPSSPPPIPTQQELGDEPVKDLDELLAVLDDEPEETLHRVDARHRVRPAERIESAQLPQLAVAPQLADQRRARRVLKNDTGDNGVPHRAHRVVVAPAAAPLFQEAHQRLVGQGVEDEREAVQVAGRVNLLPSE